MDGAYQSLDDSVPAAVPEDLVKYLRLALVIAVLLAGLGWGLAKLDGPAPHSGNPAALALCDDGTRDLNALRLQDAVRKLGQCLEMDPSLAEAAIARTMAFYRLGERRNMKVELARADSLVQAIRDDDRRMVAQLRMGAFRRSRYFTDRDSLLARLRKEQPRNIHVLVAVAAQATRADDQDAAEQAWLDILDIDPNYAISYNMLGYMELGRGRFDEAIDYMQKYAFLSPGLANARDSLGEILMVMGRYEEAEAEFLASVSMQPDFYQSLINLGGSYLVRGQFVRGLDILEKVRTQVAGSDLEMLVDLMIIRTFRELGLAEETQRATAGYISRYPDDKLSVRMRCFRLAELGQADRGRAVVDSARAVWREDDGDQGAGEGDEVIDSDVFQFEARVADARGDVQAGAGAWRRAIEALAAKPYHERWYLHRRLAADLLAGGEAATALVELDRMLAVNPRLVAALVLKVECHLELRQGAAARAALERLKWCLGGSDPEFPARREVDRLEARMSAVAGG